MALDDNFLMFIVPAAIALLAALLALPSVRRIERDPSTAYRGARRATVNIAALVALVMGLILAGFGGSLNVKPIAADVNMVQVGGLSLVVMSVVLLLASARIQRQVRTAGRGEREEVLEASVVSGPRPTPAGPPGRDLPPRPQPPYGAPPPQRPQPWEGGAPPPVPQRVQRQAPPGNEDWMGRPPPPGGPRRRGPPPG